jgi:hypothetical protein
MEKVKDKAIKVFALAVIFLLASCRQLPVRLTSIEAIEDDVAYQEKIIRTFAAAYPDKINSVKFINGDWTMVVNDKLFYYTHGRILPEELRERWKDYQPYDFYDYPWTGTEKERRAILKNPVYSTGSSYFLAFCMVRFRKMIAGKIK